MKEYRVSAPDKGMLPSIREKIDNLNKPRGSLGRLETLATQICLVQQTLTPSLRQPHHLLFGADHGIEREGVSLSPRCVTWQQMINFAKGGAGVNMFCRQHAFALRIIDVGVDHDLSGWNAIIDRKIRPGTRDFLYEPAMSAEECGQAMLTGERQADECADEGCNVLSIGEMGIGNTSPSSVWMSLFTGIPLAKCVGAGSGLDDTGVRHKLDVLTRAVENYREYMRGGGADGRRANSNMYGTGGAAADGKNGAAANAMAGGKADVTSCGTAGVQASAGSGERVAVYEAIRYFGGYEMAAALGAMLRAAERRMLILIDGFIMTACALAAVRLCPHARDYMIFCHCGGEGGHRLLLDALDAHPLLSLGLRLGEGTGALCAYPLVDSAVRMVDEMNNFKDANITKYF